MNASRIHVFAEQVSYKNNEIIHLLKKLKYFLTYLHLNHLFYEKIVLKCYKNDTRTFDRSDRFHTFMIIHRIFDVFVTELAYFFNFQYFVLKKTFSKHLQIENHLFI